ncbi:MAG: HNH endonuclease signature motif containing protein [Acutalibacteraceae bacterium]
MAISQSTLKILWAKSGGLCAFSGCHHELISKTSEDIIGHVCHIVAQSATGPRGNPNISQSEIDCEQNLILLCPTHHRIVDTDEITYTIEKLTEIKAAHEQYIYEKIHYGSKWNLNFSQLYYINLPRISIIAAFNGIVMNFDSMERFRCLHKIGFQLNSIVTQIKDILQNMTIHAIPLPTDLSKVDTGQNIEFTETFI